MQSSDAVVLPKETLLDDKNRRTILIIDDDSCQAEILAMRLAQVGFETCTASDGQAGLALARAERPHLILLDIRLPDVNGLNLCEELSDDPVTCSIPVIIVSGMEGADIVRRSRSAGCQYYVRKPYDPNALLVLIESAVSDNFGW